MHNKTLFLHTAPYLSSVFTNLSRHTTTCGQTLGESQMESFKEECGNQSVLDVIGRSVPSSPSLSQTTPISPHPALLRPISAMYRPVLCTVHLELDENCPTLHTACYTLSQAPWHTCQKRKRHFPFLCFTVTWSLLCWEPWYWLF